MKHLRSIALTAVALAQSGCMSNEEERVVTASVATPLTVSWCSGSTRHLFVGDFNGDGKSDLLCHSDSGEKWLALNVGGNFSAAVQSYQNLGWCNAPLVLSVGDVTLDGRDDLICFAPDTGEIWVSFAQGSGNSIYFGGTNRYSVAEPANAFLEPLLLGDVNGDGRTDMIWHSHYAGSTRVRFAGTDGSFGSPTVSQPLTNWCQGTHRMEITPGNWIDVPDNYILAGRVSAPFRFANDVRRDLVCVESAGGHVWTAASQDSFQYTATTWDGPLNLCPNGIGLSLGDFNGDGRSDLLCRGGAGAGLNLSIARNSGGAFFASWSGLAGWCTHAGASVAVGDYNGDSRADLLCYDTAGNKWIQYADPTGTGSFTGVIPQWYSP